MITPEDVKNLADLARIELSQSELEKMTKELDSILDYVSQIKNETVSSDREISKLRNIMRDDLVTHTEREYTQKLVENFPNKDGDYLKVKKIL